MVTAPDGVAKYMDVHLPSVSRLGARYMVIMVNAFKEDAFKDLPECYAGWMMRQVPQSDEMFEPSTVQERIELTVDARICIPAIIDVEERRILWGTLVETLGMANLVFTAELESNRVAEVAEYLTEGPPVDRTVITPLEQDYITKHFL
ncbi:hypothetical protein G195_000741 [Phytophthora kernoviae 00238/432]|uniref:Uncharacterized protein n=1 Tax=Phytophthora kernoviae 00238/432 TaxID=1284355 RepID=A0A8J4WQS9_9STRA|nr:hypothetical protein G195_000741 [Phytophthora kernoviae 00238/432]